MMNKLFSFILLVLSVHSVNASDFQDNLTAAERGNAAAQLLTGFNYSLGDGVLQDDKQAVSWYRKAAEQGYDRAQFILGVLYENGTGVPQDDKQAMEWYSKADKQAYANAQYGLGIMYFKGGYILKDKQLDTLNYKQSYMWFNLARYNGSDVSKVMKALNVILLPNDINIAQSMSKICLESNYTECD
jgi:TPR repeat protein